MFERPLTTRRASAEEVLAELVLGSATLGANTTLAEWDGECEVIPDVSETVFASSVEDLRRVLQRWFGVEIPPAEAKRVLAPLDERTLGELAAYIAERAEIAVPVAARLGGEESEAAGLFMALRGALARRGVGANRIRPSTVLTRLARKHGAELNAALHEVAPHHRVDYVWRRPRIVKTLGILAMGGLLLTIVGGWVSSVALFIGPAVAAIAMILALLFDAGMLVHGHHRYETIADWCRAAAQARAAGR